MNDIAAASPAILAYRHASVVIHTCGLVLALGSPVFLIISGAWRVFQDGLDRVVGDRLLALAALSGAAYGLAWSLVGDGVQLALRADRLAYGFEDQSWAAWLLERAEATATLAAEGLIVAALVFALILRSPRWWPVW